MRRHFVAKKGRLPVIVHRFLRYIPKFKTPFLYLSSSPEDYKMAGLEIFSAAIAALDATISTINTIHDAVIGAKELPDMLNSHYKELKMARVIVESGNEEPELRNHAGARQAIEEIGVTALAVEQHLNSLGGRGRFGEIAHQLMHGKQNKETLKRLMDQLSRKKDDLTALIGMVNVTSARMLRDRLDQLSAELAEGSSSRGPGADKRFRSRIVTNNAASGDGFMLNAPLVEGDPKEDHYKHVDYVLIRENEVKGRGVMINYAVTLDNLKALADDFLLKVRRQVQMEE